MQALPISLVVITWNESATIGRCLDSVPFAAEKLVVDSGSTDDTVAIARAHGARTVEQPWLGFGAQRNFATGQATHDWLLVLDADEYLTPALAAELSDRLPALMSSTSAGAVLRLETSFMGAPMRWYRPMARLKKGRIYHRGRARWKDVHVHESLIFDGPVAEFRAPFVHDHNPTLVHRYLKMLRYQELRVRDWQGRRRSPSMWQLPFLYSLTFFKEYVLRMAALDGWRGFIIAQIMSHYAVYKRARYYEVVRNPSSQAAAADFLARHGFDR